jgi:hypothetical protein
MAANLLRMWFLGVLAICLILDNSPASFAKDQRSLSKMREVIDVTASMLVANPEAGSIRAFDLSPDGSLLAILCADRDTSNGERLDIVLFSLAQRKVVQRRSLGDDYPKISGYLPHLRFSYDQNFIVVQTPRTVQVFNTDTLAQLRSVDPPPTEPFKVPIDVHVAAASDVVAVTFGSGKPYTYGVEMMQVYTEVIRLSSTSLWGSWKSSDVPQSLSPTGSLALISDWSNSKGGILQLEVLNSQTGDHISTLETGYAFRTPPSDYRGRSSGKFLTEREVLISPDDTRDLKGDKGGDKLKIMEWQTGNVERELTAKGLSPTGEMAIAHDGKAFAVVSWYLEPHVAHNDVALPHGSSPVIFIASGQLKTLANTGNYSPLGLSINGAMDVLRPRLSADGRRLAIAQDRGIEVLEEY